MKTREERAHEIVIAMLHGRHVWDDPKQTANWALSLADAIQPPSPPLPDEVLAATREFFRKMYEK